MRQILVFLVCFPLVTGITFGQEKQSDELLSNAIYQEEVKGNLEEAILIYKDIIKKYPEQRAITAEALFHLGLSNEKLGNKIAKEYYEQVVSNYGDQPEFVRIAKERLSRLIIIAEKVTKVRIEPKFTKIKIPTKLSWNIALSPDGKNLALVSDEKLWKMPIPGNLGPEFPGTPVQLNTEDIKVEGSGISWSGDGKWIAFNNAPQLNENNKNIPNQSIYRVPSNGGNPYKILNNYRDKLYVNYRLSLSPDGKNLAHTAIENNEQHIYITPVAGGSPKQLVDIQAREPVFSPDEKWIAYVEDKNLGENGGDLCIIPAAGGVPKLVAKAGMASSPVWSPNGKMIAFLDYNKNKQMNLVQLQKDGEVAAKVTSIEAPTGTEALTLLAGWTPDNKIGVLTTSKRKFALFTLPSTGGQAAMILNDDSWVYQPRWSRDGKQIYYTTAPGMGIEQGLRLRLASVSVNGGSGKQLPLSTNQDGDIIRTIVYQGGNRVSPDGKMFISSAWTSKDKNSVNPYFPYLKIWKLAVDGSEQIQLTNKSGSYADFCPCWSPDGKKVAFVRGRITKGDFLNYDEAGIYIIDSSGEESEILASSSNKFIFSIAWSPDGKMIAYFTKEKEAPNTCHMNIIHLETGTTRVVREFPTVNEHIELAWSPDSKKVAFNGEKIHVINIDDGSIEDIETNLLDVIIFHIDWSPDGKRFVFGGLIIPKSEFWLVENFLPLEKLAQKKEKEKESFVIRKVIDGTDAEFEAGSPSPDGKYFIFTDWDTGNLAIYESTTGKKRLLTKEGSWEKDHIRYVENSTWSPDGKQIVYDWQNEAGSIELHLVGIDGSNSWILYKNEEWVWVQTFDWSSDGKQILTCFQRKDGTRQIVLVNAENGSVRVLKSLVGKNWMKNMSFSPDGRYIVYDYPPEEYSQDRDIYVISTDGGHEFSLIKHPANDYVLGWAPDGKNILFASDRTGTFDAFVIQVTEGKPQGNPKLIKSDIGNLTPRGFTQKGSFYYSTSKAGNNVYSADLDPETGNILASPKKVIKRFEGSNGYPYYSPDGKYLAYISVRNRQGIVCIHNLETGEDREFYLNLFNINRARSFRWSPDCNSIVAMGRDNNVRFGIFRLNVQTGNVTPVIPWENWKSTFIHSGELSRDGKAVFYVDFNTTNDWSHNNLSQIMVRDLDTGAEKELYRFDTYINISLSPDGKWLASSHPKSLKVMPASGGDPRELYTFKEEYNLGRPITWSADGKYILFSDKEPGQDGWDLCRIPAEGGEPRKLGLEIKKGFDNLSVHPNNRSIAFSSKEQKNAEFWVMENFLPKEETVNKQK